MELAETPLDLPASLSRSEAANIVDGLEELWHETFGPVRTLSRDLDSLKRFFHPAATGHRVRRELLGLAEAPASARALRPALALHVGDKRLVTPEGRAVLALLRDALIADADPIEIRPDAVNEMQLRLLALYRGWSRHRLNQTLALLAGDAEPLRIPSVGLILFLLVNRSVGAANALPGPEELEKLRVVEEAVFRAASVFAEELDVSPRGLKRERESLYRGWWAGEARRRLPGSLEVSGGIHIRDGGQDEVLALAARELARRPIDRAAVARAFDAMVAELRRQEPELAQFGLAFEHAPETKRLRARLLDMFGHESANKAVKGDVVSGAP